MQAKVDMTCHGPEQQGSLCGWQGHLSHPLRKMRMSQTAAWFPVMCPGHCHFSVTLSLGRATPAKCDDELDIVTCFGPGAPGRLNAGDTELPGLGQGMSKLVPGRRRDARSRATCKLTQGASLSGCMLWRVVENQGHVFLYTASLGLEGLTLASTAGVPTLGEARM